MKPGTYPRSRVNADVNAAINLGLRGLAAPTELCLHHCLTVVADVRNNCLEISTSRIEGHGTVKGTKAGKKRKVQSLHRR